MDKEERKYKFSLRMLDGIEEHIQYGEDVSDASEKLDKKLDMDIVSILDKVEIWNPQTRKWIKHRPWWEEEKEPYEWEKAIYTDMIRAFNRDKTK